MSKAFDTINIHTLIRKLLQTNIPDTIIKFIANYIKGRKAHTTYINHTSKQRQFHPHYLTVTPQTYHHPVHQFRSWPMQMTSQSHPTHTSTNVAKKYIQPYLHKDKTTCNLFTPVPTEYTSNLDLTINNKTHIQHTHPQHLSTSTQTSTNHKSTHCNRMG